MQLRRVQYSNMLIEVLKLQKEFGTTPVNWLLDKNKPWRLVSNPSCVGSEPTKLFVPRFSIVRAFKFPSVVGSVPARPTLAKASPTTRWVFPTWPQVTPVQSPTSGQGLMKRLLSEQIQFFKKLLEVNEL
jgi:hypothetical protein